MLKVEHINKSYGRTQVLFDVSFGLESGEVVGFLGPNGAGKSTLMKLITGSLQADSGTIEVCGQRVTTDNNYTKGKIGYLPELNPLYPDMYVREYLSFVAGCYGVGDAARREAVDDVVERTGLTPEAQGFIAREVDWYKSVKAYGFDDVPQLLEETPLRLERIRGQNLFLCSLNADGKKAALHRMADALARLHSYEKRPADSGDLYREYFEKTLTRLRMVADAVPFGHDRSIRINGKDCVNVLENVEVFRRAVLDTLMHTHYTPFHGDCQLTNTLVNEEGRVFFIDPRGYFGKSRVFGDPRYDWAKVFYAIYGNFDQFNVKNFHFCQTQDGLEFQIGSGGWEFLTAELFQRIPEGEGTRKEIELIHAIVWMSMASHVWEDYDSMCIAFMNGTALFNRWLEDWHAA